AMTGEIWEGGAAYIGGTFRPIEEARISVLDLGVTRSDCTYDVVHVWEGRFYRLDAHLDRFAASMTRLRLDPGHDRAAIEAILHGCVRHAGLREAYVSMTCTRGRMPPGSRDLRTARSMFYCYAVPFIWVSRPSSSRRAPGCGSATSPASRRRASTRRSRTTTGWTSTSPCSTPMTTTPTWWCCATCPARSPRDRVTTCSPTLAGAG